MTIRERLLEASLREPVRHAEDSAKKRLRARVLELASDLNRGALAGAREQRNRERLVSVIEDIHQGSLIVDDIQDGSATRRGKPALHRAFGLPLALNAGNFLYFRALKASLEMELPGERKLLLHKLLVGAMCEAHEGQAIDLGTQAERVARAEMAAVSLEAARSKTGALLRAAFGAGYLLHEAYSHREFEGLLRFGEEWGIGLQQLDDIGHYLSSVAGTLPEGKAFEDFRLGRPTWIWGLASRRLNEESYELFRRLARTPSSPVLRALLLDSGLLHEEAARIQERLDQSAKRLGQSFGAGAERHFRELLLLNEHLHRSFIPARASLPAAAAAPRPMEAV